METATGESADKGNAHGGSGGIERASRKPVRREGLLWG
jgi:hypothetical protein